MGLVSLALSKKLGLMMKVLMSFTIASFFFLLLKTVHSLSGCTQDWLSSSQTSFHTHFIEMNCKYNYWIESNFQSCIVLERRFYPDQVLWSLIISWQSLFDSTKYNILHSIGFEKDCSENMESNQIIQIFSRIVQKIEAEEYQWKYEGRWNCTGRNHHIW